MKQATCSEPAAVTPTANSVAMGTGSAKLRAALLVAAGLLAFAGMAAVFGMILPEPYGFQATPKLRHLEQHSADFDVLFCGSSRVLRHVIAPEFDRQLAAAGHPVRSFNLGVDAMPPPESFYFLRRVLELRPRVRWVVIELWDIRTVAPVIILQQQRFINWHDLRHTALVLRRLFADGRLAPEEKFSRTMVHLRAAFRRCTHQGRGGEWLVARMEDDPRMIQKKAAFAEPLTWLAQGGFSAGPPEVFPGPKRAAFEDAVRTIRGGFPRSPLEETLRRELAALTREVRAIGAEPVFLVMPTVHSGENYDELRPQGVAAELISLADPSRFPELYDTQFHNDDWHLTEEGARWFTRYLAEEFRALLERKPR